MTKKLNIRINKPETAAPITVSINIPLSILRAKENTDAETATAEVEANKSE